MHGAGGGLGIGPGAEEEICLVGALEAFAACVLGDGKALDRGVGDGIYRGDEDRCAKWDDGFIDGERAAGGEWHVERAGGAFIIR